VLDVILRIDRDEVEDRTKHRLKLDTGIREAGWILCEWNDLSAKYIWHLTLMGMLAPVLRLRIWSRTPGFQRIAKVESAIRQLLPVAHSRLGKSESRGIRLHLIRKVF
jgi:hypothetical protein